jgi:hypothetical protein
MASILKVDTIQDQSGNNIINENADTITIGASGDTVNIVGTLQNNGSNAVGITMADQWRLTADTNIGTNADITTNWERNDSSGYASIGTGLTESSGIFSFPTTGIYLIILTANFYIENGDASCKIQLEITIDNSTFNIVFDANGANSGGGVDTILNGNAQFVFDVTNTTTHKIKFSTNSFAADTRARGNTSINETHFTVIRLGDT